MTITPREPFDMAHTLRFVLSPPPLANGRKFPPLLDYFVSGEYRRAAEIGGRSVLFGVREVRKGSGSALEVRVLAGGQDNATRLFIRALVERQFSVHLELEPFYQRASRDPVLSRLVDHFRGMRIPQTVSVYEALVSAILEQQVNVTFAHQVKKALIEAYGRPVEFDGRRYNTFPEPAALAIARPRELRRLQISGPKARYIIGISRSTLDGSLDLEGLRDLETTSAYERLLAQKGVGPWTAQYVGLRALGHQDCLPAADVGLQKAIQNFYRLRKQPSEARVEQWGRQWSGWRSYATFYLWLTFWENAAWREEFDRSPRRRRVNVS